MTGKAFAISTMAGWADMDANAHMANFAYVTQVRRCSHELLQAERLPGDRVREAENRAGRAAGRIEYFREIALLEPITVTLELAGMAADGSRFRFVNEMLKFGRQARGADQERGRLARSRGKRKLIAPPADLLAAFERMPQATKFERLPSSIRK